MIVSPLYGNLGALTTMSMFRLPITAILGREVVTLDPSIMGN
jgi:cytoplasmic iron level regulating protein YaaA (DUF328/UPF0246 family)